MASACPRRFPALPALVLLAPCVVGAVSSAGAQRRQRLSVRQEPPSLADIFVVNLDDRKDKCHCMQEQLASSPWPAHRFSAVRGADVQQACPEVIKGWHQETWDEEALNNAGLVCSNYLVLKQWLNTSMAPFLIVFEDDCMITDPGMWTKLTEFLQRPCVDWNYLMVDSWSPPGYEREVAVSSEQCQGMEIHNLNFQFGGSHMQVFTRRMATWLVKWITDEQKVDVMDKMIRTFQLGVHFDLKAFHVQANFVSQARFVKDMVQQQCNDTVGTMEDRHAQPVLPQLLGPADFWDC